MPKIEIAGVDYAYTEAGTGPLLIFGHGTFGGKALFRSQVDALAGRYRCVAFDWPGHGESGYEPGGWTVQSLVDAVPELINSLGEQSAALVGVSQGGAIFMRAAIAYPACVSSLVIICAGSERPSAEAVESLRQLGSTLHLEDDEPGRRDAASAFLGRFFHAPGFADAHPAEFQHELDLVLSHDRKAMPLVARIPASYEPVTKQLGKIRCPTLVLWGERDAQVRVATTIADAISGATLRVIPGAGHHLNLDAPLEASEAIGEFLDGLRRPSAGFTQFSLTLARSGFAAYRGRKR